MVRKLLDSNLRKQVLEQSSKRCHVCGYPLTPALRIHHMVPVSFGGSDITHNLVVVCANCHSLIHFYSSKRNVNKDIQSSVMPTLDKESAERLMTLIDQIRQTRTTLENKSGGIWSGGSVTNDAYELDEALRIVSRKNRFGDFEQHKLKTITEAVLAHIPLLARERCSFKLVRSHKYISINIMNYLIFRTPAYGDWGENPACDCHIIFPEDVNPEGFLDNDDRVTFVFAHFDCINLGLTFDEVLSFTETDWEYFSDACLMAMNGKKARQWVSNIRID